MNWQCCKIVLHRKQLEANIAEFYTENIGNKMMEYFEIYWCPKFNQQTQNVNFANCDYSEISDIKRSE